MELLRRLPIYSISAGVIVALVFLTYAVVDESVPRIGLGALGLLPLAAAMVDAIRLRHRSAVGGGRDRQPGSPVENVLSDKEVEAWLNEQVESLALRQRELNARALAITQWMQFPDAIDFHAAGHLTTPLAEDQTPSFASDPMAGHDRRLFELIESKTHLLFDSIKQDAYRKSDGERKVFDNERIRDDLFSLVSDVAAIYRPDDPSPLLKTNVEALSRAVGRASLRLLVAVESLPGGLANYDFQSIYQMVIRAVRTFGMYKSAKPYLDLASGMLFAGRIAASTNPITLVAWWAASKATTYGASKLGSHLLDQQAVGLIRQLVEIVAVEVASVYSPLVRYRDVHWVYGVELVHLARELSISDSARAVAMKQIAALNLRDEYGRVALMRQLACQTSSRPWNYRPAESLSSADRMLVAERLEAFLLAHVVNGKGSSGGSSQSVDKEAIERWQQDASDRLEIQFRASKVDADEAEQTHRAVWALASFAMQYFEDEPDDVVDRLHSSLCWNSADSQRRTDWIRQLQADPPYLYHPPIIDPDGTVCRQFLSDLVELAGGNAKPVPELIDAVLNRREPLMIPTWLGEDALRVTAYYLRTDANDLLSRYRERESERLLGNSAPRSSTPAADRTLEALLGGSPPDQSVACLYNDAKLQENSLNVHVVRIDSHLYCFRVDAAPDQPWVQAVIWTHCPVHRARLEKISGYVRSDCRVHFPDGTIVDIPGSALRSYDSYFAPLKG